MALCPAERSEGGGTRGDGELRACANTELAGQIAPNATAAPIEKNFPYFFTNQRTVAARSKQSMAL
jgi:hypothetical protein